MWDYDKLFAEENIVGLTIEDGEDVYNQVISNPDYWEDGQEINWNLYKNEELSSCEETGFKFEIQYIIRLDEHGNVVEKLFDREEDMPKPMPELKTGMFVRLADKTNWKDNTVAYVDRQNNRLIAKEGWFEALSRKDEWQYLRIVEVFSKNVCCFNLCVDNSVIWRSPEYQAYLDSKSN